MAKPSEVQQNVTVICNMLGSSSSSTGNQPGSLNQSGSTEVSNGFSEVERQVLQHMREVLAPVKDMTWPVGLIDNRK